MPLIFHYFSLVLRQDHALVACQFMMRRLKMRLRRFGARRVAEYVDNMPPLQLLPPRCRHTDVYV